MLTAKMKKLGYSKFDVAEHLTNDKEIAGFIDASIEMAEGDAGMVMHALDTAVRAKKFNMTQLAKDAGMTRSGLYEALSGKRSPSFTTVLRLLGAMGLRVSVTLAK